MRGINLKDQKFGKLIVLEKCDNGPRGTRWLCECECGNKKKIHTSDLRWSTVTSCGCIRDQLRYDRKKHGMCNSKLYKSWSCMKYRTLNSNHKDYKYYGGKGVSICKEWIKFEQFMKWALDNGYSDGLSIDRIDTNGNYEPKNCRWANDYEQANNKTNNVIYECFGNKKTRAEWARYLNIDYFKLRDLMEINGMTIEKIINLYTPK